MGQLTYLSLSGAYFGGRIPSSLGNLKNLRLLDLENYLYNGNLLMDDTSWMSELHLLEHLDMSGVHLKEAHSLLQVLNMLPSLSRLYLHDCGLDNSFIPHNAFQNMTSLSHLDLSLNGLNGTIPVAFRNLSSIQFLDLSDNNFTSVPSWFSHFEKLTHLLLSFNGLVGPIPDDAFQNMSSLVYLDLALNNLDSVPSGFGSLKKLVSLDLSYNVLHGPIPESFRNMNSIQSLDLSSNSFTSIPSWLAELKNLVYLGLRSNQLAFMECSLSSIIGDMCHLRSLDLSGNKLRGELMGHSELSGCSRYDLEELDLGDNEISDRLPTWLGQLENLEGLNFSSNLFYGPIPLSLGKLSKLGWLDLSNNKLDGPLPPSIGNLVNLDILDLSNNSFDGPIPQSLGQLVNLAYLDLSSNKLDGIMSIGKGWSSVAPSLNLWYLSLSNNQISGSLPENIGHMMPSLTYLSLGNNFLNGSIPISLCQTELQSLDLSKNNLSGEIPNCWKDNQGIWEEINLSSNKLSGVFPSSFGNLSSLFWLHLNNNNLQGELPMSLRNLKQLLILDLGENQLSGIIPSLWTAHTFPTLQILRLRKNMLSGSIPSQLCQLTSLKVLDLSRNKLEGSIPRCIGNLRGMTLNNSSDKAKAKLVPMQPYQSVAKAPSPGPSSELLAEAPTPIEFSADAPTPIEFSADAPTYEWSTQDVKEVMKGTELEYTKIVKLVVNMDLSENNLVGSIPNEITWLTRLHGLNLANNQLKGEIPKMIGDMKSLESLDMSHNQLSGTIPNTMPALTSLSHLNLSHNNLSGPIPKGNQFLTLDDPSIYADNPYLCGSPLPNKCPGDIWNRAPESKGSEDEDGKKDKAEKVWFYFVIAAGFATGFWGFFGTLLWKKNWRHAYFRWVEDAADKIYVTTVIKFAKLKKRMMRNHVHG